MSPRGAGEVSQSCRELLVIGLGRMAQTRSRHRRDAARGGVRNAVRTLFAGVALSATMTMTSPLAGGAGPSDVLTVADYAFLTANHSRPPQIVTAADVANAVATTLVDKGNLKLVINIGGVSGHPRLVLFINQVTYRQTCVDFPSKVGQSPSVIACPAKAIVQWQEVGLVLDESRDAVAGAATRGKAVSGADVTRYFVGSDYRFLKTPTFRAGQGAVVTLIMKTKFNGAVTVVSTVCIQFPKTEAGIPIQVSCKR